MVELWEEVSWARAAAIMAKAWAARAERMARESVILLASTHGEANEVAWKVSLLEGEFAFVRKTQDMVEAKLLSLVDRAADADQWQDEAEGQCEALAKELAILRIRGFELCLTIVGTPQQAPCMKECSLLPLAIPRWLCSLPRSGRRCP
jgi:hypothetical protein